jgi:hypothetical protein
VRVADCLWTLLGLFMFVAGLSSMAHLRKSRISLPLDLVGDHSRLVGGFHALFVLSLLAMPLGLWQLVRLWRFRHIPLREALPSPFGLRLGHNRTTATLVFFCQFFCLVMPVVHLFGLFVESSLTWLRPGDLPWVHGLAVTGWHNPALVSPWKIGAFDQKFWLLEIQGIPGHPLSRPIDRIGFNPFFAPAIMVVGAGLSVAALLATVLVASRSWWRRKRRSRAAMFGGLAVLCLLVLGHSSARDFRNSETKRTIHGDRNWMAEAMTTHVAEFADVLLGIRSNGDGPAQYAETVDYRSHGLVGRAEIPSLRNAERTQVGRSQVRVYERSCSWEPTDGTFRVCIRAVEMDDDFESGATALTLELTGTVTAAGQTSIRSEKLVRHPLYRAENRVADASEALAWTQALREALASGQALDALFHPVSLGVVNKSQWQWYLPGDNHTDSLLGLLKNGTLTLHPAGVRVKSREPGARSRLAIPLRAAQTGAVSTLEADLIHTAGGWRCVRLAL